LFKRFLNALKSGDTLLIPLELKEGEKDANAFPERRVVAGFGINERL
jgi:hypothetical protein